MFENRTRYEKIANASYYALMLLLPLSVFLDNVALIILLISSILCFRSVNLRQLFKYSLTFLFMYVLVLAGIHGYLEDLLSEFIKLLPLVLIPIAVMPLKDNVKFKGLFFLLLGIFIMQLIAMYGIVDYYFFTEGRTIPLRSYSGINEILHFERPYLGYFSSIMVSIGYFLLYKKHPFCFGFVTLFSVFLIVIISARLALLIILMTIGVFVYYKIKSKRIKYIIFLVFPIILLLIFTIFDTPLKQRFLQIKYDTRITIWSGAFDIISNDFNFISGLHSQDITQSKLNNYYENKAYFEYTPDKLRFMEKQYNTHNQFINELLRGGFVGLLLLLVPLTMRIISNIKSKNIIFTIILISLFMFLMVENLLQRQIGVYLLAVFLSLSNLKENENEKV